MKSELGLDSIARHISDSISSDLNRAGIMYRLFYRVKSGKSIEQKIIAKDYKKLGNKITDLIGIRITLYFQDDVNIVYNYLKNKSNFDHHSTDNPSINLFQPIRCNLTFNFLEADKLEVQTIIDDEADLIDTKYEIQLRTVLSEGWHEVEHDLRYKCKEDWAGHEDLERNLNGIYATLETSEFSMLELFNNLSHRHYKKNNIEGLIKTQFRIRLSEGELSDSIETYINQNKEVIKKFHRINRSNLIQIILKSKYTMPLTKDNFILICNHLFIKDKELAKLGNKFIRDEIKLAFKN